MTNNNETNLDNILRNKYPASNVGILGQCELKPFEWKDIRLFISSSFVDTHGERDLLIKNIIPDVNRHFKDKYINITPIDLRWGVLSEDSNSCQAIQKTCLVQVDYSRQSNTETPWFLGIRTERYGWVQATLRKSSEYAPNEHLYGWVEMLEEYNKQVSITSLECVHGALPVENKRPAPTMFFFKRHIDNPEDIEEDKRWIFEYEYVDENVPLKKNVVNQYTRTTEAEVYKEDRDSLDKYLRSSEYTEYVDYHCLYEEGGAEITGEDMSRNKKFGIGRVSHLEEFEQKVKRCLVNAIERNFKPADITNVAKHELANLPHESVIKEKAKNFVGRNDLSKSITEHCIADEVNNNVMIIKGLPGRGKSSLMAKVSTKVIDMIRNEKCMVFVHAVDSCPQSNDLEEMLIRLHLNIDYFLENSEDESISSSDLKGKHVNRLMDTAKEHPDKRFIIMVDAVNQFHETMQAWSMWWLVSDAPDNVRIIISTLPDENNTFNNALLRCPDATIVEVGDMSLEDGREMVTKILDHFNKKFCTDETDRLGDQMSLFLEKNLSPLYLGAATNVLRTQGVYEQMTEYIKNLPGTVSELFDFLLKSWSKDYGETFIQYLTCVITLAKDGLLENTLIDLLSHIEAKTKEKTDRNFSFDCSFSVVFDSLRCFLSAEGGGHIRFFHDQVNKVVRNKYLESNPNFEKKIHNWFARFYNDKIDPQLVETPSPSDAVTYYKECLRQVVYHETESKRIERKLANNIVESESKPESFTKTLRNIFFVRERIKHKQTASLQQQYLKAIEVCDETEQKIVQKWRKFVSVYGPHINEVPHLSYNMAINQVCTSPVFFDTEKLKCFSNDNVTSDCLYWTNKPEKEVDNVVLKYCSEQCWSCSATTKEGDMVAVRTEYSSGYRVLIHQMSTGTLLHQVGVEEKIRSMCFNQQHTHLWLGDGDGYLSVIDVKVGKVVWKCKDEERLCDRGLGDWVRYIQCVDEEKVVCVTVDNVYESGLLTHSRIIVGVYEQASHARINKWMCGGVEPWSSSCAYAYHSTNKWIMVAGKYESEMKSSAASECGEESESEYLHQIKCFTLNGYVQKVINVHVEVKSMCVHPHNTNLLTCTMWYEDDEGEYRYKLVHLNLHTSETTILLDDVSRWCNVVYNVSGDKLVCAGDYKTILVCKSNDGVVLNKIQAHSDKINQITLVPNTNNILTAGDDASFLIEIPSSPDEDENDSAHAGKSAPIIGCCFTNDHANFLTLRENGAVTKYCTATCLPRDVCVVVEGVYCDSNMLAHPHEQYVIISTDTHLHFIHTDDLHTIATYQVVGEGNNEWIMDMNISTDGNMCVVGKVCAGTAVVLDISNITFITTTHTYTMEGYMYSCDIHPHNDMLVCAGDEGFEFVQLSTTSLINKSQLYTVYMIFYNKNGEHVLCVDDTGKVHIMDTVECATIHTFPHSLSHKRSILYNN